jgi:hypothetical protein
MKLLIPFVMVFGLTLSGCTSPSSPVETYTDSTEELEQVEGGTEDAGTEDGYGTDYPEGSEADGGTDYVDDSENNGEYADDGQSEEVSYFTMPNVIGMIEKDARAAIKSRGFAGSFEQAENVDGNPKLSCLMTQAGEVLDQYQQPGTEIENTYMSKIKFVVDCRFIVR